MNVLGGAYFLELDDVSRIRTHLDGVKLLESEVLQASGASLEQSDESAVEFDDHLLNVADGEDHEVAVDKGLDGESTSHLALAFVHDCLDSRHFIFLVIQLLCGLNEVHITKLISVLNLSVDNIPPERKHETSRTFDHEEDIINWIILVVDV